MPSIHSWSLKGVNREFNMDEVTENNVVALLEECVANANLGPSSLWLWFLQKRPLIERALEDANFGEEKDY